MPEFATNVHKPTGVVPSMNSPLEPFLVADADDDDDIDRRSRLESSIERLLAPTLRLTTSLKLGFKSRRPVVAKRRFSGGEPSPDKTDQANSRLSHQIRSRLQRKQHRADRPLKMAPSSNSHHASVQNQNLPPMPSASGMSRRDSQNSFDYGDVTASKHQQPSARPTSFVKEKDKGAPGVYAGHSAAVDRARQSQASVNSGVWVPLPPIATVFLGVDWLGARRHSSRGSAESRRADPEDFYVRQDRIGKGSFGEVYKGFDKRTRRPGA